MSRLPSAFCFVFLLETSVVAPASAALSYPASLKHKWQQGVPHTYCAGDVCTVDQELPLQNEDGTQVVPEKSPLWFQMRLWSQARTMGQLAALSILGMHDVVDASMFFELFTHVSTFFGFKVTLLGAYNGQQLPHSDDVSLDYTRFWRCAHCSH